MKKSARKNPPDELTLRAKLAQFFEANPGSGIEAAAPGNKKLSISKPWNDDSLILSTEDNFDALANALNNIILPSRYSAIWHRDTRDLEILWTAFPPVV